MKCFYALFIILLTSHLTNAANSINADTAKKVKGSNLSASFEPVYPGGITAFNNYIKRNLHYPDAARLMCINGKVYVSFVIDQSGRVINVSPLNCLGAGCESEAVKVVQRCRQWKPGIQNGSPVQVNYTIPIDFRMETEKVYMENLAASDYGFIFSIQGKLYTVDEAEDILGKTFRPEKIAVVEPFDNYHNDPKFGSLHKKAVYLLVIKSAAN